MENIFAKQDILLVDLLVIILPNIRATMESYNRQVLYLLLRRLILPQPRQRPVPPIHPLRPVLPIRLLHPLRPILPQLQRQQSRRALRQQAQLNTRNLQVWIIPPVKLQLRALPKLK